MLWVHQGTGTHLHRTDPGARFWCKGRRVKAIVLSTQQPSPAGPANLRRKASYKITQDETHLGPMVPLRCHRGAQLPLQQHRLQLDDRFNCRLSVSCCFAAVAVSQAAAAAAPVS